MLRVENLHGLFSLHRFHVPTCETPTSIGLTCTFIQFDIDSIDCSASITLRTSDEPSHSLRRPQL